MPKETPTTNSTFFAAALDGVFEDFAVIDGSFAGKDSKTVNLPKVPFLGPQVWINWLRLGEEYLKIYTCKPGIHEEEVRL